MSGGWVTQMAPKPFSTGKPFPPGGERLQMGLKRDSETTFYLQLLKIYNFALVKSIFRDRLLPATSDLSFRPVNKVQKVTIKNGEKLFF